MESSPADPPANRRDTMESRMKRLCATVVVASTALLGAQGQTGQMAEWAYVGGEQSHSKYSSLDDIDRSNVSNLEIAWQWGR